MYRHVRAVTPWGKIKNFGGYTLAAKQVDDGYNVAVAECSINDNFCKATGRAIAQKRLDEGQSVFISNDEIMDVFYASYESPYFNTIGTDKIRAVITASDISSEVIFGIAQKKLALC